MNRKKLARRTALAAKLHDRHNPPYRVMGDDGHFVGAPTRQAARELKREQKYESYIEQRVASGYDYTRIH